MDIDEIKALMEAMTASDLSEMQVDKDGWSLRLSRNGAAQTGGATPAANAQPASHVSSAPGAQTRPAVKPVAAPSNTSRGEVRSPLSGIVHFSPSPGAPFFVETGGRVEKGDVVCLVEAMKMFNEVRAEHAGQVEALLAGAGEEVEAGQVLARIV